ncbi:MAG: TolC family protein [Cyclobacteriaceae bacterium]|nr:TolC family protein [Cyclobacteriaceae bacterium]
MRYILILIFAGNSLQLFSQDTLSLANAIQLSLERNYDIVIENKRTDIASNNNTWGQAGRYPSVELFIGQNNNLTDNIKTANPFQLQGKTLSNGISPGIAMNWVLFDGFRVSIQKSRLEQLQAESNGNAEIVISNTIQATILSYYAVVLQEELLTELQRQLKLSRDKLDYVKVKSEIGSAVSSDILLEETNYLNDSTNYLNQILSHRNAKRNLNFILAEQNPDKEYVFSDKLQLTLEDYALQDLILKMEESNSDLRKQYISESIRQYDVQLAKSEKYPSVTFSGGFTNNNSRVDLSNAYRVNNDGSYTQGSSEPLTAVSNNLFANFRVSFTLFNGGRINTAISNAYLQEEISSLTTEKIKLSLYRDMSSTLDEYNMRKQVLGINDRKLEVAQKNLNIANEKFRNGTINSFDFRTVQNNQLSAAIQRLVSLYNVIDSQIGLMRLTGGILEYR